MLRIGGSGPHHCLRQLQEQLRHPIMRNSTGSHPHHLGMLCRTAGDGYSTMTAERGGSHQRLKLAQRINRARRLPRGLFGMFVHAMLAAMAEALELELAVSRQRAMGRSRRRAQILRHLCELQSGE